jgi:hypothetical protein
MGRMLRISGIAWIRKGLEAFLLDDEGFEGAMN